MPRQMPWRSSGNQCEISGAGHQEATLAGGASAGIPDWGLGLAPETASLLAVSVLQLLQLQWLRRCYIWFAQCADVHERQMCNMKRARQ